MTSQASNTSAGNSRRGLLVALLITFLTPLRASAVQQPRAATGLPQPSPQVSELLDRGFEFLSKNDSASAEEAFRKALDLQPEIAAAHRGLGRALRARGQGSAALRELQTAVRLDANNADAHYDLGTLAWTLLSQPQLASDGATGLSTLDLQDLAMRELGKAVSLQPQSAEYHLALADFDTDVGKKSEAVAEAEEAVRLAANKPFEARARVTLGRVYFAVGEENKAAAEYQHALERDPAQTEALLGLGQLWLFQRKYSQAEGAFRHAIQVSPRSAAACAALAEVLVNEGRAGEARQLLEKAVALDPLDWHSQYLLASLVMDAGEAGRAVELLQRATTLRPDYLPTLEALGKALLRRGDTQGAQARADSLVAMAPQASEGHRLMALILWKRRDYDGALAECAMALANEPDSAAMLALQAICLWQLDRKKEARSAFLQAGKVEPKVGTAEVFCRLLLCDAHDIGIVGVFLQKNRWVLEPAPTP